MSLEVSIIIAFLAAYFAAYFNLLSPAGSFLGAFFAILIMEYAGLSWFLVLFSFFVISAFSTILFRSGKSRKTVSESRRGWRNVAANGAIAFISALAGNLPAFVGAVSAVTADTVSCEIGELSGPKPKLITTFKTVPTGTNGGITILGEIAGILGALLIGGLAYFLIFPQPKIIILSLLVGFLGTNFDSLLGAIFENKGVIGNHEVNFLTSLFGAFVATLLMPLL